MTSSVNTWQFLVVRSALEKDPNRMMLYNRRRILEAVLWVGLCALLGLSSGLLVLIVGFFSEAELLRRSSNALVRKRVGCIPAQIT